MLHRVFDTAGLSASAAADMWMDCVSDLLIPNRFRIEPGLHFHGTLKAVDLGATQVVNTAYSPLRCQRTAELIRRSDPELYMVGLSLRGRQGIVQSDREADLGVGDLALYSSSEPYEVWAEGDRGRAAAVVVQFPRTVLPVPERKVDRLLGSRFTAEDGVSALLTHFLRHLAGDTGAFRPTDGPRLGMVLLDLVTALLAHAAEDAAQISPESHQRTLFLRIQAFVHRHLADPDLSTASIAAAHHVSSRQVQRLFHRHGDSVAAYIRQQRLERARRDLAEPALADRTIHVIAARWGFTRPEVFTRAFRDAYGVLPRDYRHQCLHERLRECLREGDDPEDEPR
jgi:AraC-like DNA-binding protein